MTAAELIKHLRARDDRPVRDGILHRTRDDDLVALPLEPVRPAGYRAV